AAGRSRRRKLAGSVRGSGRLLRVFGLPFAGGGGGVEAVAALVLAETTDLLERVADGPRGRFRADAFRRVVRLAIHPRWSATRRVDGGRRADETEQHPEHEDRPGHRREEKQGRG